MNTTSVASSISGLRCAVLGGTGALGQALAARLARAGHQVFIGSRDPAKARDAAALAPQGMQGGSLDEAAAAADVVFVAVPHAAQAATLQAVAPTLAGKIVVDATVPLRPPKVGTVQLPAAGCAALEARALLEPLVPGVRLVSALQTIGAEKLARDAPIDSDVLVASDDADAAATVIALLDGIGLRGWHVGPLANAAAAEAMTSVLIQINRRYKIHQAGLRITGHTATA